MDLYKVDAFWRSRQDIEDSRVATNYRDDGRITYDVALVSAHLPHEGRYLDLGAGTGTLTRHFLDRASTTVAVEKWPGFLSQLADHPRLRKVQADILTFETDEAFDLITLFGVMNFVPEIAEEPLIARCHAMLDRHGVFIAKHQCGVDRQVIVDQFSQELGSWYHARYPSRDEQVAKLEKLFKVQVVDIYPAEVNRWHNTHFYAFVCSGKAV